MAYVLYPARSCTPHMGRSEHLDRTWRPNYRLLTSAQTVSKNNIKNTLQHHHKITCPRSDTFRSQPILALNLSCILRYLKECVQFFGTFFPLTALIILGITHDFSPQVESQQPKVVIYHIKFPQVVLGNLCESSPNLSTDSVRSKSRISDRNSTPQ